MRVCKCEIKPVYIIFVNSARMIVVFTDSYCYSTFGFHLIRLSTIVGADQILVVHGGRIAERGR